MSIADRELLAELRRSTEGVAFDELPMPELSIADLDLAVLKEQFHDRRDLGERELLTLRLLTNEQGRRVPTQGAVLLVGRERARFFPDAWVQCGRFIGRDKADIFDHAELHDPLPQAVESIFRGRSSGSWMTGRFAWSGLLYAGDPSNQIAQPVSAVVAIYWRNRLRIPVVSGLRASRGLVR